MLDVARGTREGLAQQQRSGLSIGLGGSTGGYRSGVGLGGAVSFPVGKARSNDVALTMTSPSRSSAGPTAR